MKKRIIGILLITALLIFGCCACAKDTGTTPEVETAAPSDTSKPEGETAAPSDTSKPEGEAEAPSDTSKPEGDILAEQVKVGDYVNYNAASGNGAGKSYKTEYTDTGWSGIVFESSEELKWKVMSVDKATGTVELMAENPTAQELYLFGIIGYKNGETVLNDIGAIYGCGDGATGGRSISIEDINKLENYTPEDDTTTSYTYTSGYYISEDWTKYEVASEDAPVTMSYTASTAEKSTDKAYGYTTANFGEKTFWLSSHCKDLQSGYYWFYMRMVLSGEVNVGTLYSPITSDLECCAGVLPVVTLKANIQTSGQDENGAWNLIIE